MAEVKTRELTFDSEESAGKKNIDIKNLTDDSESVVDVAGGMGRHLGVFSCTMIMYVQILFYPTPVHYY